MTAFLSLQIIDSPLMWGAYGLGAILLVALLIRRWTARPAVAAGIASLLGAVVGMIATVVANETNAFGVALPIEVALWATAGLACIGFAVASLWRSPVWRKVLASVSVIWFAVVTALGINASFGLNPTVGALFGVVAADPIDLPRGTDAAQAPARPIYQTWRPPAGLALQGDRGTQNIPGTRSGFDARDASVYLPPAALVDDAPALPLVIMMMGHPGNPDGTIISDVLDEFAAQHSGLAPVVLTVDQLGADGSADPACADSPTFGNAETYVTADVVAWARENLKIIDDPKYWIIAGYSNGGGCAVKYGAKYPQTFQNIIDVSGEEFPGSEDPDAVTSEVYDGDAAAFDASKPAAIMRGTPAEDYAQTTAVFTAGSDDPSFLAAATTISAEALRAGMTASLVEIPDADHGVTAVTGGLREGFSVLFPVLGLAAS